MSLPARAQDDNCQLALPPKAADVIQIHGFFLFVYPAKPSEHYTGCQLGWMENKQKIFIARLKDGALVELDEGTDDGSFPEEKKCYYSSDGTPSDPENCAYYETMKHGIQVDRVQPTVPPERDIRTDTQP